MADTKIKIDELQILTVGELVKRLSERLGREKERLELLELMGPLFQRPDVQEKMGERERSMVGKLDEERTRMLDLIVEWNSIVHYLTRIR